MRSGAKREHVEIEAVEPFEEEYQAAFANKTLASAAQADKKSEEAKKYFALAQEQFLDLIRKLKSHVYRPAVTGESVRFFTMTEENAGFIYRYAEAVSLLGELHGDFDQLSASKPYILEYIKLRNYYKLGDESNDSLCHDYYNLGLCAQEEGQLAESNVYLIRALGAYRTLNWLQDADETAAQLVANFLAQAKVKNQAFEFSDEVKDLITTAIAKVISIDHLLEIFSNQAKLFRFFSIKRWEKDFISVPGIKGDVAAEEEKAIHQLQRKFLPDIFEPKRTKKKGRVNFSIWATEENAEPSLFQETQLVPPALEQSALQQASQLLTDVQEPELEINWEPTFAAINEEDLPSLGM